MKENIDRIKNLIKTSAKNGSLNEYFIEIAYLLFISSKNIKRTRNGNLLHRKDARFILANKIRIDRTAFDILISEMENTGLLRNRNKGIYIISRST